MLQRSTATDRSSLRIELLGGFRISFGDRAVAEADWRLTKARSLVKLLALADAHRLHREQIVDVLWPDLDPAAANNNFHQALFSARRAIATVAPPQVGVPALQLQRQILSFEPTDALWVDVLEFERRSRNARRESDPQATYAALELYAGDLLPEDRYEDWPAERRESLRVQYLSLLLRLTATHEARGEYVPAIDAARRVIEVDAANEDAHVTLMRLYALTGRMQQALRQYQRLREILESELDAEPAPETDRLFQAIRERRFPAQDRPARAAASLDPHPAPIATSEVRSISASTEATQDDAQWVFVDREFEVGELRAAVERAMHGRQQLVILAGEPGIGKTRTVEHALGFEPFRHAWIIWGRCHEGEGTPDLWPWIQVLREIVDRLPAEELATATGMQAADIASIVPELRRRLASVPQLPRLTPEQERFRLFDGVSLMLKDIATRRPLVLVLDDLHWADRASLLLFEFVARELRDSRAALIGLYRDTDIVPRHPLERMLAQTSRHPGSTRLHLSGLGPSDVACYSALALGRTPPDALVDAIHQQTEGNPFFMSEVVRLISEEHRLDLDQDVRSWRITVPRGVRETILLRLDRLTDEANRVLTVAAVCGHEFEYAVVQPACELEADNVLVALEAGIAAGILVENRVRPGQFKFSHVLIRQTLYEDASIMRRAQLHRRIGETIEHVHALDLDRHLGEVAQHYVLAAPLGATDKALEFCVRAAQQAITRVAYAEAVGHVERALRVLDAREATDAEQRCDLLLLLGEARAKAGQTLDARSAFLEAGALARALGSATKLAQAALGAASIEEEVPVDDRSSIELLEGALSLLGPADAVWQSLVAARLSQVLFFHDPLSTEQRRTLSDWAVITAQRRGDARTTATALLARLVAHWQPENLADRLKDSSEIVRLAEEAGDDQLALTGHAWHLYDCMELGDMEAVDREIEAYGALARELRLPYNIWSLSSKRTMRALMRGHFDEASNLAQETLALGRRPAPHTAEYIYLTQQFAIARELGGLDTLKPKLLRLDTHGPIRSTQLDLSTCLLMLIDCGLGDLDDARDGFQRVAEADFNDIPRDFHWMCTIALLSEICAAIGDARRAERLYSLLRPFAGRNVSTGSNVVCFGPAARFLALLAACMGWWDVAERHFLDALIFATKMDMVPSIARIQSELGGVLIARNAPGDSAMSLEMLEAARSTASSLGMTVIAEQVDALLSQAIGVGPKR